MDKLDIIIDNIQNIRTDLSGFRNDMNKKIDETTEKIISERESNLKQNIEIKDIKNDLSGLGNKVNSHLNEHKKKDIKNAITNMKSKIMWGILVFFGSIIGASTIGLIFKFIFKWWEK